MPDAPRQLRDEDVEKGVRTDPERALQALAMRLGLMYDTISDFMARAKYMAEADSGSSRKAILKKREQAAADIPESAQCASKPWRHEDGGRDRPPGQLMLSYDEESAILGYDPKQPSNSPPVRARAPTSSASASTKSTEVLDIQAAEARARRVTREAGNDDGTSRQR